MKQKLYLGTWQLTGVFVHLSKKEKMDLLSFAYEQGITHYETAVVYSNVEQLIGDVLPKEAYIVTKIPAIPKPTFDTNVSSLEAYRNYERYLLESLGRLKREIHNAVLLHNWIPQWSSETRSAIDLLIEAKENGLVKKIGISLPDNFACRLPESVLSKIDILEVPCNPMNSWIVRDLSYIQEYDVEVILRSIFCRGLMLKTEEELKSMDSDDKRTSMDYKSLITQTVQANDVIQELLEYSTSIVIGMTSKKQIIDNLECYSKFKKRKYET